MSSGRYAAGTDVDVPLVMRFKGPGTLDAFISALAVHRFHVWPDQDYTDKEGLL